MKTSFLVMREHIGDKAYSKGDVREASAHDVAHLVRSGVLVADGDAEKKDGEKSAPAPKNKPKPDYKKKVDPPPSNKGMAAAGASGGDAVSVGAEGGDEGKADGGAAAGAGE
jgi:hypothetical protein